MKAMKAKRVAAAPAMKAMKARANRAKMVMPALFYANGLLEGMWGMTILTQPTGALGQKTFHADGEKIVSIFVPSFIASSLVSLLMAKQADTAAKQLYSLSWLVYHVNAAKNCWKGRSKPALAVFFVVHAAMTIGFGYYLKQTGFKPSTLSPL